MDYAEWHAKRKKNNRAKGKKSRHNQGMERKGTSGTAYIFIGNINKGTGLERIISIQT